MSSVGGAGGGGGAGAGAGAGAGGGGGGGLGAGDFFIQHDALGLPRFTFYCKINEIEILFFPRRGKTLRAETSGIVLRQILTDQAVFADPLALLYLPEYIYIKNDEDVNVGVLMFRVMPSYIVLTVQTRVGDIKEPNDILSAFFKKLTFPNDSFFNFVLKFWNYIGEGKKNAQYKEWFTRANEISQERKQIIGLSIRQGQIRDDINIKITVQEVRNYVDPISKEEISTRNFNQRFYVVLNLTKRTDEDPWLPLSYGVPIKEAIKKFTIISIDNLIKLATLANFKDPRTSANITSVHYVYFSLDETRVNPREAELPISLKRPLTHSLGEGKTYYDL